MGETGRPDGGDKRDDGNAEATMTPPERAVEEAARPGWGGGRCGRGKVSLELRGHGAPARPYRPW